MSALDWFSGVSLPILFGIVNRIGGAHVFVIHESNREYPILFDALGGVAGAGFRYTVGHEMCHAFGGLHEHRGLVGGPYVNDDGEQVNGLDSVILNPITIRTIRERSH